MTVLITGGAGYIGSHVNEMLADAGIDTLVVDDLSDGHKEAVRRGSFLEGDLGDEDILEQAFSGYPIDSVMHFAAFASVPDSVAHPGKYYMNNIGNMQKLLDACVRHGVKDFVFSSSASTFGNPEYIPMDEEHPQIPINPYGYTKLVGEQMLSDYEKAYGLRYCAFRYFCAAGDSKDATIGEAHDPETHLIPVMVKAVKSGKPFKVFGVDYDTRDGSCIRDFIHVLDIASAHILGLQYIREHDCSDAFNLGSGTGFTVLEMVETLGNVIGESVPYEIAGRRAGDPPVLVASNEKAIRELGWKPEHSEISEILQDAWNWESNRTY